MAATVPHVRKRGGVYQFERRVPESVKRHPAMFAAVFGSKPLYRRSLRTTDRSQVYAAADAANRDFESLVARATGRLQPPARAGLTLLRKVTEADCDAITAHFREVAYKPLERTFLLADSSPSAAAELERVTYELEVDAEQIAAELQPGIRGEYTFVVPLHESADRLIARD
ncbi:MAG: hypothetical protein JWM75_1328, partial [Sphingomonas bacterium]|nr:hypothetical protein [Sphingomonas bacterium]